VSREGGAAAHADEEIVEAHADRRRSRSMASGRRRSKTITRSGCPTFVQKMPVGFRVSSYLLIAQLITPANSLKTREEVRRD